MVPYHRLAGRSPARLAALSDGIFAVAMTILVLELRLPEVHGDSERAVWDALGEVGPRLVPCFLGFVTLGMFWIGQQAELDQFERTDRGLVWIHLMFLFAVSIVPFCTSLLVRFPESRTALACYWLDLLVLGLLLLAGLGHGRRRGLAGEDAPPEAFQAIRRRIIGIQVLYAASMVFCLISTYVSIALIVLLQMYSAVSPRMFRRL